MKRVRHKLAILIVWGICVSILVSYAYYREVLVIPFVSDYMANIREEAIEYEIYSEYINANIDNGRNDIDLILISKNGEFNKTSRIHFYREEEVLTEKKLEKLNQAFPEIEKETIRSFWLKNSKPINLEPKFKIKKDYKIIDLRQFKKDKFDSTNSAVYEKYPKSDGVFKLSRIGFNKDLTEALIYLENDKGPARSNGGTFLLEKKNGSWITKSDFGLVWFN